MHGPHERRSGRKKNGPGFSFGRRLFAVVSFPVQLLNLGHQGIYRVCGGALVLERLVGKLVDLAHELGLADAAVLDAERALGDGHQFGVQLTYKVQPSPDGLAQAFIIGEEFIGNDSVAMVLGDNIFFGHGLNKRLKAAVENAETGKGATVFGYYVDDPERFGIVEFDSEGKAISIEEKPEKPKSNYCVTGLYFYDNKVVEYAKNLKPSPRGELEITDLNRIYLEDGSLNVELLGQGFTWLDTGTHESLVEATNFVKTIETHQHRKIACLEEIGYLNGWIGKDQLLTDIEPLKKNQYGQYLMDVMNGKYIDK